MKIKYKLPISVFVLMLMLSYSSYIFGCMFPNTGDKYNALIKIDKLSKPNHYRIEVPVKVGDKLIDPDIGLIYDSFEDFEIIETIIHADKRIGEFVVHKEEFKPFVHVIWLPKIAGMCGIYARTAQIDVVDVKPWWIFW